MRPIKRDNLVIDVGMHGGEDSRFYLAKGFDVVAVEANPVLVQEVARDLGGAISLGRLQIFNVAVAEAAGTARLAVSDEDSIWSSLDPEFVERNVVHASTEYRYVDVPTLPFEDILAQVGIPRYLKVDIEGLDMLCVRALRAFEERPDFVSIESAVTSSRAPFEKVFDELAELWSLGYRRFNYVDQTRHELHRPPNPPLEGDFVDMRLTEQQSGLFGEETPGRWSGIQATLARAEAIRTHHNLTGFGGAWSRHPGIAYRVVRKLLGPSGWYDLHARA